MTGVLLLSRPSPASGRQECLCHPKFAEARHCERSEAGHCERSEARHCERSEARHRPPPEPPTRSSLLTPFFFDTFSVIFPKFQLTDSDKPRKGAFETDRVWKAGSFVSVTQSRRFSR